MFRIINNPNILPWSFPLHPSATFQPGQMAELDRHGNNIVINVSSGKAPMGIIDDTRTSAFSKNVHDEEQIALAKNPIKNTTTNLLVTSADITITLDNASLIVGSFTARQITPNQVLAGIQLTVNEKNGVVVIPAGTMLNFDTNGDGILDSVRFLCSYSYWIPNYIGDDTTKGSNRITVWYHRMIIETDMYEANRYYPLNAPLFCSQIGKFTPQPVADGYPSVGFVIAPPNRFGNLTLMWH